MWSVETGAEAGDLGKLVTVGIADGCGSWELSKGRPAGGCESGCEDCQGKTFARGEEMMGAEEETKGSSWALYSICAVLGYGSEASKSGSEEESERGSHNGIRSR